MRKRFVVLHTVEKIHTSYERIAVPGGWVYESSLQRTIEGSFGTRSGSAAIGLCFVPDPSIEVVTQQEMQARCEHEWTSDYAVSSRKCKHCGLVQWRKYRQDSTEFDWEFDTA